MHARDSQIEPPPRRTRHWRGASVALGAALGLALIALMAAPRSSAAPILFPPTPNGPAEWRDERDVAPYLAAWKAEGLRRSRSMQATVTPNQQGYDARGYDLDLTFTPATAQVAGTVRMQATVLAAPLATLDLDLLANMSVDAVTSAGVPVSFTRLADVLTVNLDRAYSPGESMDVRVTYHGSPVAGSFGFTIANNRQLIWSLSEPYGARSWWPCKDAPEDKADSVTVRFTVPSGLTTASNGTLLSAIDNGITFVSRWRESHPIATYLVSIASYPYTHTLDWYRPSPTDSMRIDFFNFPETAPAVAGVQAKVKSMIASHASHFGPYPFADEKYGHAQFVFGGGMEHQTCTSLGAFAEFVVAHELAHQWWGDWVTCRDFHHIWLNEGFATYAEGLWAESQGGPAALHADLAYNKYFGPGTVYVANDQDPSRIFDSNLSYDKASWVLHMLRHVLGDSTFFAAFRQYGLTHAYGTATTEDFRAVFESVSGRDLAKYFQEWVYGEFYPVYHDDWSVAPGAVAGYDVTLVLEQRQSWQLFTMPVDVRISTAAGPRDFVVPDSLAAQTFTLHVDAVPNALTLDADDWILKQVETEVTHPAFDRALLVVNGVDWGTFGSEITSAYTDAAFSGDYPFDFWDHFPAPAGGYPAAVPGPLGHGAVPGDVLGHYRNVIWVGGDFNRDLDSWLQSPVLSYLRAGGNLLLLATAGDQFLGDSLRTYLGIQFTATGTTITDCVATRPGLTNLARTNTQSLVAVFDTVRTRPDTELLWKTTVGFAPQRGLGVVRRTAPVGQRPAGGALAFLSGRPYRWNHAQLHANINTLLANYFLEPLNGAGIGGPGPPPARLAMAPASPDPFTASTGVRCVLPAAALVRLTVSDLSGRSVRTLHTGPLVAGPQLFTWDGRDDGGRALPAGIYWLTLEDQGTRVARRVVRLR